MPLLLPENVPRKEYWAQVVASTMIFAPGEGTGDGACLSDSPDQVPGGHEMKQLVSHRVCPCSHLQDLPYQRLGSNIGCSFHLSGCLDVLRIQGDPYQPAADVAMHDNLHCSRPKSCPAEMVLMNSLPCASAIQAIMIHRWMVAAQMR